MACPGLGEGQQGTQHAQLVRAIKSLSYRRVKISDISPQFPLSASCFSLAHAGFLPLVSKTNSIKLADREDSRHEAAA